MKEITCYISIDPHFGKSCIKGTRIAVVDILECFASGLSHQDILKDYPSLKEEHIMAALSLKKAFVSASPISK